MPKKQIPTHSFFHILPLKTYAVKYFQHNSFRSGIINYKFKALVACKKALPEKAEPILILM